MEQGCVPILLAAAAVAAQRTSAALPCCRHGSSLTGDPVFPDVAVARAATTRAAAIPGANGVDAASGAAQDTASAADAAVAHAARRAVSGLADGLTSDAARRRALVHLVGAPGNCELRGNVAAALVLLPCFIPAGFTDGPLTTTIDPTLAAAIADMLKVGISTIICSFH